MLFGGAFGVLIECGWRWGKVLSSLMCPALDPLLFLFFVDEKR